jgi:hypothetical protein
LNAPLEVEKRTLQIKNPKIPIANTSAKKGRTRSGLRQKLQKGKATNDIV